MSHITEEQIEWIYTRYDGDMINCANAVARQAVVSYIDQQARELPVLPESTTIMDLDLCGHNVFYPSDMLYYGDQRAAHAREVLAKQYRHELDKLGLRNYELRQEIEALKGK